MLLKLVVLVIVSALSWLYLRWRRVRQYWARRNVPHMPPHPVLGSLTFLQKENPGLWMRYMYEKFNSPYIGIWLFWRPALIVNSPEIARRILVKDFDNFRDRFLGSGKSDPIGGLNMFTVNDPIWSSVRRRLTSVFTSAKLKSLHNLVSTKSKDLVQRIKNDMQNQESIELRSVYADYTTDVIGTAAFGVASDSTLTGKSALRKITKDFQKFSLFRGLAWCSIFFIPELVDVFGFSFFPKASTDYFKRIFRQVVEQRGGYENEDAHYKDLLDALLKMKRDAAKDNEEMDEILLISQAVVFLQAGFDTSAGILSFLTYELAFYPEIQEKLYQELLEAKQKNGGDDFDASVYSELTYLNCVIKEALRKYPPMGWFDRIAANDYKIDDSLTIPAGTPVYVNGIGMMTDPNYFPDPDKFNPDRFLPENEKNMKPFTFMPFGEGPRNCIGQRFAYQTIRHALVSIALNFKLQSLPDSPPPSKVPLEKRALFITPGDLHVKFVPRT